jgi:hypothetical protein
VKDTFRLSLRDVDSLLSMDLMEERRLLLLLLVLLRMLVDLFV